MRVSTPARRWDLREVVLAEPLLLHAERAVVGRDALQVVEGEAAPQLILLGLVAQRRAHHVLRAAEIRLLVVVVGQEQVLRAGFGERRQPRSRASVTISSASAAERWTM
jgi:hypothetical protein